MSYCKTCHYEHTPDPNGDIERGYSDPNFCISRLSEMVEHFRSALEKISGGGGIHDDQCVSDQGSRDNDCMDDHRCYCAVRAAEIALKKYKQSEE